MPEENLPSSHLQINAGATTSAGVKAINEDAVLYQDFELPNARVSKGVCGVVADGVSSAEAGREASLYATTNFVEQYANSPDAWSVKHAGQKILSAINLSLFTRSHQYVHQDKGYLCTFTAIVFKSRLAHYFHVGDSRLYRVRSGEITQITDDHCINLSNSNSILSRAVGMDNALNIDYGKLIVEEKDYYFLTSDGVHDFVPLKAFVKATQTERSSQEISADLVELAKQRGSDDNLSCVCFRVDQLPNETRADFGEKMIRLPFPPDLSEGTILDGYEVVSEMFASSRSQVYRVRDTETGELCVMKTPSANFIDDVGYIDKFIQEEWIGKRVVSEHVVKIVEQKRPRTFLYYLMEEVAGQSLDHWMKKNPLPRPSVAIKIVDQIGEALKAFHEQETVHHDLKPANVMIDDSLNVVVIDFGSVYVAGLAEVFVPFVSEGALGTVSYSDPQFLLGKNSHTQSDIYALATIAYELFTCSLPYGEDIENCTTRYDFDRLRYRSARYHNPRVPIWFDRTLERGCSISLEERYHRLSDFLGDLHTPNPIYLRDDPHLERSTGRFFWQVISVVWALMMLVVIALFVS